MVLNKIFVIDPSNFTPPYDHFFCEGLRKNYLDVHLLCQKPRPKEKPFQGGYHTHFIFYGLSELLLKFSPLSYPIKLLKGLEHFWGLIKLLILCILEKPDVIHFQWLVLPLADLLFLPFFKRIAACVLTVHDTQIFHGAPSSNLQMVGYLQALRQFHHFIVHTNKSVLAMKEFGIPQEKISLIPHGVLEIEKGSPHPDPPPNILLFGNLRPYKAPDLLVQAMAQIPFEIRKGWVVRFAGQPLMDFSLIDDIAAKNKVAIEKRFEFLSEPDLDALLKEATILAFPYREIDASGAFMLALSYAKPIIASRVGMFAEMIKNGENGLFVEPGSLDDLKDKLQTLIGSEDLRKSLSENSFHFLSTELNWTNLGSRTKALYLSLQRF